MEEVSELLKTWELEELIPEFNKQQITIQSLSALTDADVKELIPLTGPRSLFMRCWRTWKAEFSSVNKILDFSLSDSICKDLIVIQESPEEKENLHSNLQFYSEESSSQCMILENLLKESLDSATLLEFKGRGLSSDGARNLLAAVIAKAILTEYKNSPINGAIYYKWANQIKALFPGERTTTYYIPACTTANGIILQAKGKLVNQVLNKRRRLQNLGALPKANRKRSREESPTYSLGSSPSPRPLPNIFTEEESVADLEDDVQWLENSSEPWSLVEEKWQRTQKIRTRILYESNNDSIEKYFEKYPALRKPQGYSLLLQDFNGLHGIYKNNLFTHFPLLKIKLQELLKQKKTTDAFYQELITLNNSSNEEISNLSGFLTIPLLLNTATVKQKKKRSSEGSHSWKPSKAEVREGFIKHVKSSAEISQAIEHRLATLKKKALPSQPYIIVVGESLEKIISYLIVANKSVIYERQSIMHAVDTCYKIVWALNLEYGIDTYPVWYFIQKGLYKMSSAFDKGSIATESLLSDCNV